MGRPRRIQDDELLAIARQVFVEKGIGASTRAIARRAGISEAVIYQRHPTKADLFFAAMVPPAVDVEALLAARDGDRGLREHLEEIALRMLAYFRELIPILLPLMTHPSFDLEEFARRHPDAPLHRMRVGLRDFLETQRARGRIRDGDVGPAALALFSSVHSLAVFERLGAHGGRFDEAVVRSMVGWLWTGLVPHAERAGG